MKQNIGTRTLYSETSGVLTNDGSKERRRRMKKAKVTFWWYPGIERVGGEHVEMLHKI